MENPNRLSVVISSSPLEDIVNELYVHRFYQDVYAKTIPYSGGRSSWFSITPDNEETVTFICNLLTSAGVRAYSGYRGSDARTYLKEFVSKIAGDLAIYGASHWELVTSSLEEDDKKSYTLYKINGIVDFVNGEYRQILSQPDQNLYSNKYISIPKSQVWKFDLPASLGEQKTQLNLMKELAQLSDTFPKFFSEELSQGSMNKDFDVELYSRKRDIERAKVSRHWGWSIGYGEDWTGYYYLHRELKFKLSLAKLRDEIVKGLNNLFEYLDGNCKIAITGLNSAEEIEQYIEQFRTMDISYEDVRKVLYNNNH